VTTASASVVFNMEVELTAFVESRANEMRDVKCHLLVIITASRPVWLNGIGPALAILKVAGSNLGRSTST